MLTLKVRIRTFCTGQECLLKDVMLDEEKVVLMRTNSKSKNNFTDLNLTYTLYLIHKQNKPIVVLGLVSDKVE